ncbi:MAG: hypothetical protein IPK60_21055 [Sandaracinaceae bacterium]|nr:hypothetical protein [Sandaracinaceae bacterium]
MRSLRDWARAVTARYVGRFGHPTAFAWVDSKVHAICMDIGRWMDANAASMTSRSTKSVPSCITLILRAGLMTAAHDDTNA